MTVARTNLPDNERAGGATTPLLRAITHIGYILGGIASVTTETWESQHDEIVSDVRIELGEASAHLTNSNLITPNNAYISAQAVAALSLVRSHLEVAGNADWTDLRDLFDSISNIAHNLAYAGEYIDRDTFGLATASAGRAL